MSERDLHLFVVDLIRFHGVHGLIAYHPANEGLRAPRTGAFLKRMGMLPGVADLALVLPGGHAAFIELKTAKGRTTPDQRAFRDLCEANGTPYHIVRTPEEAAALLTDIGALRENPLAGRRAA